MDIGTHQQDPEGARGPSAHTWLHQPRECVRDEQPAATPVSPTANTEARVRSRSLSPQGAPAGRGTQGCPCQCWPHRSQRKIAVCPRWRGHVPSPTEGAWPGLHRARHGPQRLEGHQCGRRCSPQPSTGPGTAGTLARACLNHQQSGQKDEKGQGCSGKPGVRESPPDGAKGLHAPRIRSPAAERRS